MIELDRVHPHFDLQLELLCLLSAEPAPLDSLADDLGITPERVRKLVMRLRAAYDVCVILLKGRVLAVVLAARDLERAARTGSTYMRRVYG